jgi:hypothetical protein
MTSEKDIVLIYLEDKPMTYARLESINPDWKKGWYHVKLMMLQIPIQAVTWILRDTYIDGGEFTMNGVRMRFEKVVCPEDPVDSEKDKDEDSENDPTKNDAPGGNVITFKKKDT